MERSDEWAVDMLKLADGVKTWDDMETAIMDLLLAAQKLIFSLHYMTGEKKTREEFIEIITDALETYKKQCITDWDSLKGPIKNARPK